MQVNPNKQLPEKFEKSLYQPKIHSIMFKLIKTIAVF